MIPDPRPDIRQSFPLEIQPWREIPCYSLHLPSFGHLALKAVTVPLVESNRRYAVISGFQRSWPKPEQERDPFLFLLSACFTFSRTSRAPLHGPWHVRHLVYPQVSDYKR